MENSQQEIALERCSLEQDGTVTCKINKAKFDGMQNLGIKPRRVVFEIEG